MGRWASDRLKPPVVIGHEFAGEVAELGREAAAAGLSRSATWSPPKVTSSAATASSAASATRHLCRRTQIIGVDRDGAFAEYIVMPASNVMKLDGIPTEIGAIMDPIGNAVHTVLEGGGPRQHACSYSAADRSAASPWAWPARPGRRS